MHTRQVYGLMLVVAALGMLAFPFIISEERSFTLFASIALLPLIFGMFLLSGVWSPKQRR